VEVPFATVVDGVVLRGRMDAVFAEGSGGERRFDVIDWKTGAPPEGDAAAAAAVQLAAYRLAWADLSDVPVEHVRAGFHYVRSNLTVRPVDLLDAGGLAALLADLPPGS
jgi:DNA helicase-2/ATP-dependent DNA helicase PcrA